MENYKVETIVDEAGMLTILYQVTKGVANRSLGLNIAKLVGFPEEIVEVNRTLRSCTIKY